MSGPAHGWSDERVEQTVGNLLRVGLILSTVLVIAGAVIYLSNHGSEAPEYRIFRGEPPELTGIPGIVAFALDWRGRGIIQLGLLVLLATPVARVMFSIIAFAVQRDWFYVGVTIVVLTVLLYSVFGQSG